MPFADPANPEPYARRSKRRQRINKRGHPPSQGDKLRPCLVSKARFCANHEAIDWGKAAWNKRASE